MRTNKLVVGASIGVVGLGGTLLGISKLSASRNGETEYREVQPSRDPSVDSSPLMIPSAVALLISERSAVSQATQELHAFLNNRPTGERTIEGIFGVLQLLSESERTKALRPYASNDRPRDIESFIALGESYLKAQASQPEFTGSIDVLPSAVATGKDSIQLATDLTQPEFFARARESLNDLKHALRQEFDSKAREMLPVESLTGYSLRTALASVIRDAPETIQPRLIEGRLRVHATAEAIDAGTAPLIERPLPVSLNLEGLDQSLLQGVALGTGRLSVTIDATGGFIVPGAEPGYLLIQRVWWHQAGESATEPVLVSRHAITNFESPRWAHVSAKVQGTYAAHNAERISEARVTDAPSRFERQDGYVVMDSWVGDDKKVETAVAKFYQQWTEGFHPGYAAEQTLDNGTVVRSGKPAALVDIMREWGVREGIDFDPRSVVDLNNRALVSREVALAQTLRTHVEQKSGALQEARALLKVIDWSVEALGSEDSRARPRLASLLSVEELRAANQNVDQVSQVLRDLDDRFQLLDRSLEALQARAQAGQAFNLERVEVLKRVVQGLENCFREEAQGLLEFAEWGIRPFPLGPTDARWMEQEQWDRLRSLVGDGAGRPYPPYFSLIDPRTDAPEQLDIALGYSLGTSRLLGAIEVAGSPLSGGSQSHLDFNHRAGSTATGFAGSYEVPVYSGAGDFETSLRVPAEVLNGRLKPGEELLLRSGVGRLVFVDAAATVPVAALHEQSRFEAELRQDLLGDPGWASRTSDFIPRPSKAMNERIAEYMERTPPLVRGRVQCFMLLQEEAALGGAMVPLGEVSLVFARIEPGLVATTLGQEAARVGRIPPAERQDLPLRETSEIGPVAASELPAAISSKPENSRTNLPNDWSSAVVARSVAADVLSEEAAFLARRMMREQVNKGEGGL